MVKKMSLMMILVILLGQLTWAQSYNCKATNSAPIDQVPIVNVILQPTTPTLTVITKAQKKIELIDGTYLGLATTPIIWALRDECEMRQTINKDKDGVILAIDNYFYCLLQDEAVPIGKISAHLTFDFQMKTGSYSGLSAPIEGDEVQKFEILFTDCHE